MRDGSTPRIHGPAGARPAAVRRPARPALAILVAGTAALGLTACGGSDGDDEATVAPDAAPPVSATTTAAAPAAGGDEESRAGAVVTQYVAAFSAGDGEAVCRLYTPAQRRRIADAADDSCAEGIRTAYAQGGGEDGFKRSLGNLRVGAATVTGRTAVVRLVAPQGGGGDTNPLEVQLQRSGDTWRISRPGGAG
ncbi:hypothetical protein [Patulibacter sp.]|uniref:hypothetical protein n=1 Tax=Patulibacter sp. TaxID=1912859 RepID=UPI0027214857|nr:hypothetical protein [Patulibacter sp.]MDO9408640.1 hypothetical protein [Patulibacter sp.]